MQNTVGTSPTAVPAEKGKSSLVTERTVTKKIGGTTYIITSRFNGDNRVNISRSLIRLIEREI
jgi:hypothetical protein